MRIRNTNRLALSLLFAAGLGVCSASAQTQSAAPKKSPASKSGSSSHKGKSRKSTRRERGQKAPTPDRISEIQTALAKDGSFPGKPNGKWDAATIEATRKFQEAHGLNPSGKLDAKTLQQLGLGSQTAGVAPPLPPTGSASAIIAPSPAVPRRQ